MKNRIIKLLTIWLLPTLLCAQEPDPQGLINTSFPLFTLNYEGMAIPISLNYSQAGVRVDELSGWTGQGWELNTGWINNSSLYYCVEKTISGTQNHPDIAYVGLESVELAKGGFFGGAFSVLDNRYSSEGQFTPLATDGHCFVDPNEVQYYFGESNNVDMKVDDSPKPIRYHLTRIVNAQANDATINYNYQSGVKEVSYLESFKLKATTKFIDSQNPSSYNVTEQPKIGTYRYKLIDKISCKDWTLKFTYVDSELSNKGVLISEIKLIDKDDNLVKRYTFSYTNYASNDHSNTYKKYNVNIEHPGYSTVEQVPNVKHRAFLTEVKMYNSANTPTKTWGVDYYNPELLPERITFKKNVWGYYMDYKLLGSTFTNLLSINATTAPNIIFNQGNTQGDIDHRVITEIENELIQKLPPSYFGGVGKNEFLNKVNETETNKDKVVQVKYGMLKSITYPLGMVKEFDYTPTAYGNLLESVTVKENESTTINTIQYAYRNGAIPLSPKNFIVYRDIPQSPTISDLENYSGFELMDVASFNNGAYFLYEQPTFNKIIQTEDGKSGQIEWVYSTAASEFSNNELPCISSGNVFTDPTNVDLSKISCTKGEGEPTSKEFMRGLLQSKIVKKNATDIVSKTDWIYWNKYPQEWKWNVVNKFDEENNFNLPSFQKQYYGYNSKPTGVSTTRYEYSKEKDAYIPVGRKSKNFWYVSSFQDDSVYEDFYDFGSRSYQEHLKAVTNNTYTGSSTVPSSSNGVLYYYPEEFFTELELVPSNYRQYKPIVTLNVVNNQFVGGKFDIYDYYIETKEIEVPTAPPSSIYTPQIEDSYNVHLNNDEVLIVMSKTVYDTYNYKSIAIGRTTLSHDCGLKVTCKGDEYNYLSENQIEHRVVPTNVIFKTRDTALEIFHNNLEDSQIGPYNRSCYTDMNSLKVYVRNSFMKDKYFSPAKCGDYTEKKVVITEGSPISVKEYSFKYEYKSPIEMVEKKLCSNQVLVGSYKIKSNSDGFNGAVDQLNKMDIDPYPLFRVPFFSLPDKNTLDNILTVDMYDGYNGMDADLPLQITNQMGVPTAFLYEFDRSRLQYKVEGVTYDDVADWNNNVIYVPADLDMWEALPNAHITKYIYDNLGRMIEEIDTNQQSTKYLYNEDGQLFKIVRHNKVTNTNEILKQFDYEMLP